MPRADIRRFWEQTRKELDQVPVEASLEVVEPDGLLMEGRPKHLILHRVVMSSFEGRRIRAWLTLPTGQPPARGWPAVMVLPGYSGITSLPVHLVRYGHATLTLYPRGQGESMAEWQVEHGTRLTYQLTDRNRYYYRGVFMDCIRGLDFLASRPEIDEARLGVWGTSQGGGLTLATAALDHRVQAAVAEIPWLCNFPVAAESTAGPYAELHDYLAEHPEQRKKALATLEYFDPLNLADDITCPVLVNTAVIDEVHPYRTIMPVFERIPSLKSIMVYPDVEHGMHSDFAVHAFAWLDRYLR